MLTPKKITSLFNIEKPIIQAGMIWASGWRLASAVSNAGGLGIIGSGSMYPEVLREHIQKSKAATDKPFAVNIPLLYPDIEQHVNTIINETQTGSIGDGKIFVFNVENVYRIRTKESGESAI